MSVKGAKVLGFTIFFFLNISTDLTAQLFKSSEKKAFKKKLIQNEQKAVYHKELYLSLKNIKGKERKYHLGDPISIRLEGGQLIQGEISNILEDEIHITEGNREAAIFEIQNAHIEDIAAVNRHEAYKGLHWEWSVLSLSPFFDDWIFYGIRPGQDPSTFVWVGVVEVITLVVTNRKKIMNPMKIENGKRELRVLRY